jgi:hypothetical protein
LWIRVKARQEVIRKRLANQIVSAAAQTNNVNTPPPERRWLQITAQSRIGPPSADSGHLEVVVRFQRGLVLHVLRPYLLGHVAAAHTQ